jgi:hypothetical protein
MAPCEPADAERQVRRAQGGYGAAGRSHTIPHHSTAATSRLGLARTQCPAGTGRAGSCLLAVHGVTPAQLSGGRRRHLMSTAGRNYSWDRNMAEGLHAGQIMHHLSNTTADSRSLPASVVIALWDGLLDIRQRWPADPDQFGSYRVQVRQRPPGEQIRASDRPLLESPPPSRGWTRRPPRQPSVAWSERTPPSLRSHRPVRRGRRIGAIARARL